MLSKIKQKKKFQTHFRAIKLILSTATFTEAFIYVLFMELSIEEKKFFFNLLNIVPSTGNPLAG